MLFATLLFLLLCFFFDQVFKRLGFLKLWMLLKFNCNQLQKCAKSEKRKRKKKENKLLRQLFYIKS